MATILDSLLDDARRRVEQARVSVSLDELRARLPNVAVAGGRFHAALAAPGVRVIAEVKRASPSKGDLAPGISAVQQGQSYRDGGAAAISVLTEPERFKGTLEDLTGVSALGTPTLRKDFIVDEYMLVEAVLAGASAALLIVAGLVQDDLVRLHDAATTLGLDVLVEVHDETELERAIAAGATIIGVNARDLRTFDIDRDAFARLRPLYPAGVLAIAESGIRGPDDVGTAAEQGADAVLVGESVVTAPDPRAAVRALVDAGLATAKATTTTTTTASTARTESR